MDTLVLSSQWEPMYKLPWRKVLEKLWAEKMEVLEYYTDRFIGVATGKLPMPSVVRFVGNVRKRYIVRGPQFKRHNVWLRDGKRCAYCGCKVGRHSFTYDHVMPASRGGKTVWENIVASCEPCNSYKGNRTPKEAGMKMRVRPHKPDTLPGHRHHIPIKWAEGLPQAWRDYLGY